MKCGCKVGSVYGVSCTWLFSIACAMSGFGLLSGQGLNACISMCLLLCNKHLTRASICTCFQDVWQLQIIPPKAHFATLPALGC